MARVHVSGRVPYRSTPAVGAFLLLVLLSSIALPASGQTPASRVQEFGESARGYALMRRPVTGVLEGGTDLTFHLDTTVDQEYMVVGYCGVGCDDLNLAVADSSGREVASDRLPDAQPMVAFTGESTQGLWISVAMASCAVESCEFAVGVYRNSQGERDGLSDAYAARMRNFKTELGELGYAQVGEELRGSLPHSQEARAPLRLQGGFQYQIGAVCDEDCLDIDLILEGPAGDTVESDLLRDAFPVLLHVPPEDGEYALTARMAVCFLDPCSFRVVIMAKEEGLGPGGTRVNGTILSETIRRGTLGFPDERLGEGGMFDTYSIPAEAGQTIIADLRSDDFDTFLAIQAIDGTRETNDDYDMEANHSHIEWVAPLDGSYRIVVTTLFPEGGGDYVLQLAVVQEGEGPSPDTTAAAAAVNVTTHSGMLEAGDEHLPEGCFFDPYTIQALAGQTVLADLVSEEFDTYLIIEAPDGSRTAHDDYLLDTGHSRISIQAPEDGTYTILVTTFSAGSGGHYVLQLGVFDEP
jgi:hypothetical protein